MSYGWQGSFRLREFRCFPLSRLAFLFDRKNKVTEIDFITGSNDRCLGDAPTIDISAIRTFRVCDDKAPLAIEQLRMPFGDVTLGEDDVISLNTADTKFRLAKFLATILFALLGNDDRKRTYFG